MSVPASLSAYRQANDLTLEKAGLVFGVDKTTFMRWEAGGVPPKRAREIQAVTGVPLHCLRPDVFPEPAPVAPTPTQPEPAQTAGAAA